MFKLAGQSLFMLNEANYTFGRGHWAPVKSNSPLKSTFSIYYYVMQKPC